jgi:hypothetical protein
LDTITADKLKYETFTVSYNEDIVPLANALVNTRIYHTVIDPASTWTGADNNTTITVGDAGDTDRLFSAFDPEFQTTDEMKHKYTANTIINAYVSAGSAVAGNARITIWYTGTLNPPSESLEPTYSVAVAANTVNEGGNATFTVTTTNLADQTLRFKVFSNSDIVAAPSLLAATSTDFNSISGANPFNSYVNFSMTSNTGSFTVPIVNNGVNNNALTWSGIAAVQQNQWQSVATDGAGVWIAVSLAFQAGGTTRLMRSTDNGITWSAVATQAGINQFIDWYSVAYGDGVWVAVGSDQVGSEGVIKSTNGGVTWTVTAVGVISANWNSVATDGAGVWVAVGNNLVPTVAIYNAQFPPLNYDPNDFQEGVRGISSIDAGRIIRSDDNGVTWTEIASGIQFAQLSSVASDGAGVWVAVASLSRTITFSDIQYEEVEGIQYEYVNASVTDSNGLIMRSTVDGEDLSWSSVQLSDSGGLNSVTHVLDDVWVAVGDNKVVRSTNSASSWTAIPNLSSYWNSVAYGDGVLVAVASFGTDRIIRSTDGGATWAARSPTAANNWMSVAYGDGAWVAVADDGTNRIMRSIGDRSFYVEIADSASNAALANSNVVTIIDSGSP